MRKHYPIPKEQYLTKPGNESCYEYLQTCAAKITADIGDYTAIINNDNKISISRLFSDVEQLASFLSSRGVKRGDVYSVFLPTSVHAFTAFYALNKLGVIASFIHPMTPPGALEEMLLHTKSKGIFMLDFFAAKYPNITAKYECILCSIYDYVNAEFPTVAPSDSENIHIYADLMTKKLPAVDTVKNPGKETAVYLSGGGTTGKSKTIMLSSFAMNSGAYGTYLFDAPHEYGTLYSLCVLPCFHAYGLDVAMHYAVCNAYGCIVMPQFDAHKANEIVHKYKIALILGVPNMFTKMFNADNFEGPGLKYLKHLACGGDVVSDEFLDSFNSVLEKHGCEGELVRGYALTEMCSCCVTNELFQKRGAVGYPYENVELGIISDEEKYLPAGEIGEIIARGDVMMNGYLPDENIKDSGIWRDENGVDWVRTGDIGYLDEDGFLFFTGRKKRIMIISGYNIYPYTIEQKVNRLEYIAESCAVQGSDSEGKPIIRLFVSLTDANADRKAIVAELNKFCEYNLDKISRPREIIVMDALPRTKMDKIDFMALTTPVSVAS